MYKVSIFALLLIGITAGAHSFYSEDLDEAKQPVASNPLFEGQKSESDNSILYAGNVPCNPAKEVCED